MTATTAERPPSFLNLLAAARKRQESAESYRTFQGIQAGLLQRYMQRQQIDFSSSVVLDLGCGHGGYSQLFESQGAQVLSCDFERVSREFFDLNVSGGRAFQADATSLPVKSDSVDFVFCASLIEHVADPVQLVEEMYRILKPGGRAYLSFPPFYSPVGGHQFKPFHLLGQPASIRIYKWLSHYRGHDEVDGDDFADAFGYWGLYPRTIGGVRRWVVNAGFEVLDQSTRYWPINVSKVPFVAEFITWHVQFMLEKPRV